MGIEEKIRAVISRGEKPDALLGAILGAAGAGYGAAMRLRAGLYEKGLKKSNAAPLFVLSLGNLTLGGTGKTPLAMHTANLLAQMGIKVAIASRGYGGSLQKRGGVVSDGSRLLLAPQKAGDEPFLMGLFLEGIPVVVGANRFRSALFCAGKFNTQALVCDDAFQHLSLARNLDIVLVDGKNGFGNGRVFPRGPLREPISALSRAHALVITRSMGNTPDAVKKIWPGNRPVFHCFHEPEALIEGAFFSGEKRGGQRAFAHDLSALAGKKVFAFSGIADNQDFFSSLVKLGAVLAGSCAFADHHAYTPAQLEEIAKTAIKSGAKLIVTTTKDAVRLGRWNPQGISWHALSIRICMADPAAYNRFIKESYLAFGK
ncbi:MAG: tetraacyldisaccharide 4'-kinase [Desulfatibacillaceae bacterium]|nr:tetraacyldisaccharide 4'-kinase [Desulfatibacillaceae bacterium]